jgi:hypothetical protein
MRLGSIPCSTKGVWIFSVIKGLNTSELAHFNTKRELGTALSISIHSAKVSGVSLRKLLKDEKVKIPVFLLGSSVISGAFFRGS